MGADSRSRLQLDALARVAMLLEEAAVDYWLFGGWAVDFYAGYVSRAHDDVDLAVWLDDLPHVAALLEADGWRHAPEEDEDGGTGYERDSVRLDNGHEALGYVAGRMKRYRIKVFPGDRVRIELSSYDLSKGRIVYRLS